MQMRFAFAAMVMTVLLILAGCGGGADRSALAKQTVQTYWNELDHLQIGKAYGLLSPGVQGTLSEREYGQDIVGFLKNAQGITAKVRGVAVSGDCAVVHLQLYAVSASSGFNAWQELGWVDANGSSGWRITEHLGTVSNHKETCPSGS